MTRAWVNALPMDAADDLPKRPDDPLTLLRLQDLDPLSMDELHARIEVLEAEIARTRGKVDSATSHRATAESLFKR